MSLLLKRVLKKDNVAAMCAFSSCSSIVLLQHLFSSKILENYKSYYRAVMSALTRFY